MVVFVSGITSFIGSECARSLLKRGYKVVGIIRPNSPNYDVINSPEFTGLRIEQIDYSDDLTEIELKLSLHCVGIRSKCWLHFSWAGPGSKGRQSKEIQDYNIEVAQKALIIADRLGCKKFLFAGSQAEYGTGSHDSPCPISEYGKAKRAFGIWALEYCNDHPQMKFIHMRIFSVYGKGDHQGSLIMTLVNSRNNAIPIQLSECSQQWSYLEITDCVNAMLLLLTNNVESGTYDIASHDIRLLSEYIHELMNVCQGKQILQFGARESNVEGTVDMNPDLSKIDSLGFIETVSFREGIKRLIQ